MATPEMDNFFLVGMFEQWKKDKDQPALMQADHALAFAHDISELARTEFLAQAEEALVRDKLDVAEQLYGQAKELDIAPLRFARFQENDLVKTPYAYGVMG